MSRFLKHTDCPECGSTDNLAVYDDHEHCFSEGCDYDFQYGTEEGDTEIASKAKPETKEPVRILPLPQKAQPGVDHRSIDSTSVNKYHVTVSVNPDNPIEAVFPRFNQSGEHVANQIRYEDKGFSSEGDTSDLQLFGQPEFPAGGKTITITEGYYDTLAAFQLTGSRYPNVGVQSASSAKKEIIKNFEYVNSFDSIILNFDSDKPGQDAAKACAILFAPGKVRILSLAKGKDANDYLMNGWSKDYQNEWWRAAPFMPDGLITGNDERLKDEILNYVEPRSIPYPWKGLNNKLFGVRTSELVLIMADTGIGKTSVFKEWEYSLLNNEELKAEGAGIGFLHLEEPKRDLAIGLMSIHKNKPYHFPDVERTREEMSQAYDEVMNNDRVVIWDHFGSNDIDVVLAKIRHMAAMGCRYIFLDHLSIIVSDQSGDERKQLDEISTKIKTLTMELDIAVFCVIHTNRQGEARGSAGPEQVANMIMRLERDKKEMDDWRRNITRISVEKNRKFGRTGPACWLFYNEMTGRLEELSDELAQQFEMGGNAAGHEFDTMKE